MPLQAILFDLDNTLYPATSGLMRIVDTRITEYVQRFLGLELEQAAAIRREYFITYGTTLRGLQQHHEIDIEDYLSYVHDLALDSFLASDAELDHLLGELSAIRAIFTNSPVEHAQRVLRALGIERHFDHIFDIRFFAFHPKPDPTTYASALAALGVTGGQTLLIEDSPQNLPPAQSLGLRTILIGSEPCPAADYIVPDILAALRVALELEDS